ncbi:MAG: tRNA pseudouridine(55) synthase TruB [Ureaplasma sp.]|nr:tRNA pseudouridine(55) synthase TruB [Ureaplasma sp.]
MDKIKNKNIILINKPLNWTSNDVVQKVKSIIKPKKIGHGGTLDPLASGLLVLGVNEATKELQNFLDGTKTYIAEIIFGFSTDTYDMEGQKKSFSDFIPSLNQIIEVLEKLKSNYDQIPPIYSAIKINGKKAYELARSNKNVELKSKNVKIYNYKIITFSENILKIELEVSKGFYIRSLAFDLGKLTNSASTLYSLVRTKIGNLFLENAIEIKDIYDYWNKH